MIHNRRLSMNKKITVVTILVLVASVLLFPAKKKEQQELYLKAVSEKDPATQIGFLKEYVEKYGAKQDRFLVNAYFKLSEASHKLKNYDDVILYGEKTLNLPDLPPQNKLNLLFYLSNSFYTTKKDFDKAIGYADQVLAECNSMLKKMEESQQDSEKTKKIADNYRSFFIAPAYKLQALILYMKDKDNVEGIKQAADKAFKSYEITRDDHTKQLVFTLAVNLFKKKKAADAIEIIEKIIDPKKVEYNQANLLARAYLITKNKSKSIYYYEQMFKAKPRADLALKIGAMVHKTDVNKGVRYFANSYVLGKLNKESDAYKYLEHLYFNQIAKDKSAEEKEKGFKEIIEAAKARFGIKSTPADSAEKSASE
jgi:hypothetical protein